MASGLVDRLRFAVCHLKSSYSCCSYLRCPTALPSPFRGETRFHTLTAFEGDATLVPGHSYQNVRRSIPYAGNLLPLTHLTHMRGVNIQTRPT